MIIAALLGLILLIVEPVTALWRSRSQSPPRTRERRYISTIVRILILLVVFGVLVETLGLTAAEFGLAWPPNRAGLIGFALGFVIIAGLLIAIWLQRPRARSEEQEKALADLPQGGREIALFLILAPLLGFGWELLYRGFLLWWLAPMIGTAPAVLAASLAYGLAHGWQSWKQSIGSITAALLFTSAYAVTGSLWWLIFIHTALPMVGMLAARRTRAAKRQMGALPT